jgi:WD40 repeat protein
MHWELTVCDIAASRQRFTARWVYHIDLKGKRYDFLTLDPNGGLLGVIEGTPQQHVGLWSPTHAFLSFSPDGWLLAGTEGEPEGPVRVWEVATGKPLAALPTKSRGDHPIAFGGDGKLLAVACDQTIRLWDLTDNRECGCFQGHRDAVRSLAFTPDGRTLATGSRDRTLRLWDIASGLERVSLSGWSGWVDHVAFSADGRRMVAADDGGTIRVWEAAFPR